MVDAPPLAVATALSRPARYGRVWLWFLVASAVGLVVFRLVPDGLPRDVIYQIYGLASAAAILVGVRLHHPSRPLAWYLMAIGQLIWSIADAIGSVDGDIFGNQRFPSPADPVYLIGYPVVAAGLILLIRGRRPRRDLAGFLDAAILTVALGVLSWVLLAKPTIIAFQDSVPAAIVGLAYPIADIMLAALLIRLITTPGGRTRSYVFLVVALALLIVADTIASAYDMLTWDASDRIDVLWLASYAFWGAAALHPSMVSLSEPLLARDVPFSRKRLAALTIAVLVAPGTLAVQALAGVPIDVWAIVVGSVVMFLLVLARVNVSIRQLEAVHAERELARAELAHQAAHDALTGLPNRAQALVLIKSALSRAQRSGAIVGLLFVDLDGFKQVNDTLGHQAGDEVLNATAGRMQAAVRAGDVVARLGGDEFVVLLEPVIDEPSAVLVAERLVADIAEPIRLSTGRAATVGASIGVAINADSGTDPERLLQEADHAVYRAKAAGRGRVEVFAPSLRAELERRSSLEAAINAAVQRDTVLLRHTAIVDLTSRTVVGRQAEACLPEEAGGSRLRQEFLDVVDGTDTVCELDAWVLRHALRDKTDAADGFVAIPVTGRHLSQSRIVEDVLATIGDGTDPAAIMLMVPADEAFGDTRVLANLGQLRRLGVKTCADGFGAGASPTDRWAHLPFDYVRLDNRLLTGSTGTILLRLTVETAHAFGYGVVAGAIADQAQVSMLATIGCELGQGPVFEDQTVTMPAVPGAVPG